MTSCVESDCSKDFNSSSSFALAGARDHIGIVIDVALQFWNTQSARLKREKQEQKG